MRRDASPLPLLELPLQSDRAKRRLCLYPRKASDLLWAAYGINRPGGDRTAPYWRHVMVIDIYVAMADGVWIYEPKAHTLYPHLDADIRSHTGLQEFVATAPINLVYVAHGERRVAVNFVLPRRTIEGLSGLAR